MFTTLLKIIINLVLLFVFISSAIAWDYHFSAAVFCPNRIDEGFDSENQGDWIIGRTWGSPGSLKGQIWQNDYEILLKEDDCWEV